MPNTSFTTTFSSDPSPRHHGLMAWLAARLTTPALTAGIVWLLTATLIGPPTAGQEMRRLDSDQAIMLREIGALLELTDDGLRVMMAMPAEARQEAYRDVDVRRGDVVLMINGQRIRDLAAAREVLDQATIGDEIALGIRRGGSSVITRYVKADPATLPEKMVFGGPGPGGHGVAVQRSMSFEGDGELTPLMPLGVILQTNDDDEITVAAVLPAPPTEFQEGDVLRTVGGNAIESAAKLAEQVEAAEVGTAFEVVVDRGGESVTVRQAKAAVSGSISFGRGPN